MCFSYDGTCDIYDQTTPKARKFHECFECGGKIKPGQVYELVKALFEGDWTTTRVCERCTRMRRAIEVVENRHGCKGQDAVCPFGEIWSYLAEIYVGDRREVGIEYFKLFEQSKEKG